MVVIFLPAAAETGVTHERTGWPSRCTVQAPHRAAPQPNLVPVMSRLSRMTQSRGVTGSASTLWVLPLICRLIMLSSTGVEGLIITHSTLKSLQEFSLRQGRRS